MKNHKPRLLVVVLALVMAMFTAFALMACGDDEQEEPTPPTTYTISYACGDGATGTAPASVSKAAGEKITLPDNPFTKADHTFAGWSDGTQTYAAGAEFTVGSANVTFTATWTKNSYTVAFAGGTGATGEAPANVSKQVGDKFVLPVNSFTKADNTFVGWTDGTSLYAAGDEYTVTANATLTAEWFADGQYVDSFMEMEESLGDITVENGSVSIVGKDYSQHAFTTEYDVAFLGSKVVFSNPTLEFEGYYVNGMIVIACDVQTGTVWNSTDPIYTNTLLVLGVEQVGYAEGFELQGKAVVTVGQLGSTYVLFANGMAVAYESDDYDKVISFKVGSHTHNGNIYTFAFAGEKDTVVKIVSYATDDEGFYIFPAAYYPSTGLQGAYTLNDTPIYLDDFGLWDYGTATTADSFPYYYASNGVEAILVMPDDETTFVCTLSGNVLTDISDTDCDYLCDGEYPPYGHIYYNGSDMLALFGTTENELGSGSFCYAATLIDDYYVRYNGATIFKIDGVFVVNGGEWNTFYYTLNGTTVDTNNLDVPDKYYGAWNLDGFDVTFDGKGEWTSGSVSGTYAVDNSNFMVLRLADGMIYKVLFASYSGEISVADKKDCGLALDSSSLDSTSLNGLSFSDSANIYYKNSTSTIVELTYTVNDGAEQTVTVANGDTVTINGIEFSATITYSSYNMRNSSIRLSYTDSSGGTHTVTYSVPAVG